jgi:hypothetical protein
VLRDQRNGHFPLIARAAAQLGRASSCPPSSCLCGRPGVAVIPPALCCSYRPPCGAAPYPAKVDGRLVGSPAGLLGALEQFKVGDKVTLLVARAGDQVRRGAFHRLTIRFCLG